MHKRIKSALGVFIFMVVAFLVVGVFDYTDDYVADRFHEAVEKQRDSLGETFSLDGFLQYYDWDEVCVVTPGSDQVFKTRAGTTYKHQATSGQAWSLVFVKGDHVEAEITVEPSFLGYPSGLKNHCFDRWAAVFSVVEDEGGRLRLSAVNNN